MKKKLYVIAIIIALVMSLLVVNVEAANQSFSTSMKASSTNVDKGKEFTINVSVSNLNVGDKGINSLSGYLTFDDKVFEAVSSDSIEGLNGCSVTYSEDSGKLLVTKVGFINKDSDICQITLKTKSNTTATKGTVELKDIVASNSESEITADTVSLEIGIGESKNSNGNSIKISSGNNTNNSNNNTNRNTNNSNRNSNNTNKNSNTENENSGSSQIVANTNRNSYNNANNTNINTNRNNNNNNSNNNANETNDEEMPDTGLDDTIVKAILLVGLVGVLGYIKLKSLDK